MQLKLQIDTKLITGKIKEQAQNVLFGAMLKLQELAQQNVSVDVGRLRSAIRFYPTAKGYSEYTLTDGVDYGVYVEYGTSPHYVSAKHLKDWARRVLGDEDAAYPIAKKIARDGTDAHPFFRPALDQVNNIWINRLWEKQMS